MILCSDFINSQNVARLLGTLKLICKVLPFPQLLQDDLQALLLDLFFYLSKKIICTMDSFAKTLVSQCDLHGSVCICV